MTPHQLRDTATRHQVFLERLKTGQVNDFNKVFERINRGIKDSFRALSVDNLSDLNRADFASLLGNLQQAQTDVFSGELDTLLGNMSDVAAYESAFEARSMKTVMTKQGKAQVRIPEAQKAFKAALKRPVHATGDLLEPLVQHIQASSLQKINAAVRIGYDQGVTVQQMVKRLLGTTELRNKDGVTAVTKRQTATIIRTAVQHVASTARQVTWEENKDIVIGVEWVSTLDSKTTAQCRSLDGHRFKLDQGPRPPIHPNCRSTTAPDMDPAFDFLDKGATRSSAGGYVNADQTYYDWLGEQDDAFQNEVLGPTRGKLFRDGGLSADRFAELQLDKNWDPITLDEMRKLEPLAFQRAGLSN